MSHYKLTEEQVSKIKKALQYKVSYKILANTYGVSTHTINAIKSRKVWEKVEPAEDSYFFLDIVGRE